MKKKTLWILMAVLILLQLYMLFIPPVAGVQDDGTLYGILTANGLYRTSDANFDWVYGVESGGGEGTTLPILLVKWMSGLFTENLFLVPILALIYIVIFDVGVYLAFSQMRFSTPWLSPVLFGMVILFFGDKGYVSYFNSLTYEGGALAFLSLTVGAAIHLALSKEKRVWNLLLLAAGIFLFAGSSKPLFYLALPGAVLLTRFLWERKEAWWRVLCVLLAVLVLVGNVAVFKNNDVRGGAISRYQSVFYGVMKDASEAEIKEAVSYFGLPESAAALAGTTFYDETAMTEEEKIAIGEDISYGRVASYYFTHPKALWRMAKASAANAFFVQQGYLGYSQWNDVEKPSLGVWNTVKKMLPIQHVFMLAVLWIAAIAACILYRKERPVLYDIGLWLLLSSLIAFFLPGIFFGYAQISKTIFPFALLMDTVILFVAGWGIETLMVRQRKVKEKYGITQ